MTDELRSPFQDPETERLVAGFKHARIVAQEAMAAVDAAKAAENQAIRERDRWEAALDEHLEKQRDAVWTAARAG